LPQPQALILGFLEVPFTHSRLFLVLVSSLRSVKPNLNNKTTSAAERYSMNNNLATSLKQMVYNQRNAYHVMQFMTSSIPCSSFKQNQVGNLR
jgi:hypothetical protein